MPTGRDSLRDEMERGADRGGDRLGEATGLAADLLTLRPPRSWPRRMLPRSLLGRSLLIILLPLVLLQVISTWIFYDRHYDTITRRLSQYLAGDVGAVVQMIREADDANQLQDVYEFAWRRLWLRVRLLDTDTLSQPSRPWIPSILDKKLTDALAERLDLPFVIDTHSLPRDVWIEVDLGNKILYVLVPRERLFSETSYIFIMWMVGTSIILAVVALLFMRNQVKPIRRLAQVSEMFGKGVDVSDFKPEGATEVRQASIAFLRMRERIRRQIEQRTTMLAGVSHDLRTPLTRMKLELALLGEGGEVEALKHDVTQMERMIEGYLAFARGEGTEQPRPLDLGDLLRQVAEQARREGASVDLHIEERLPAVLRREAMRRCLANLINNAQRYGGQVTVTAGRRREGIEILVDDDGPGIPPEQREEVFKPFFRLERSRNPETGGTGLGLTIARDVVRSHGGDLTLDQAPAGGLRARIWLPQ
ncbi:two-component system, OmpR family, osmolarity sensor histidine kinase EnvZ [Tistlia consotensis]|uniref:histidine kinase n=1 Tax=Tistlia consotensis USBA 355 TaxID=560819 RepID=A0A1Y6CLN8_9PROT|nr:ATP-binding protein [Tistlia consotensis]SMF60893.1 two-component system, OmpR family, osmolarity sensor histidine kinase EnvZ [Tistlia consotensis USBA 355]SNR92545.1 two-component system, OmpR family, osmolarity sensor histidine kinase EnvZ [Tistlia consotensis]